VIVVDTTIAVVAIAAAAVCLSVALPLQEAEAEAVDQDQDQHLSHLESTFPMYSPLRPTRRSRVLRTSWCCQQKDR